MLERRDRPRGARPGRFRSSEYAQAAALFRGDVELATDDGSAGRRAYVTELLREELDADPAATVYACGPPPMLEAVTDRFAGDDRVTVATHDFEVPLAFDGPFDAIVSSLAIHHCDDERKQALYAECAALLTAFFGERR